MVVAGIVAGGIGSRMGQRIVPKQFLELCGKPVIIHTIEKFMISTDIDYIVVGVPSEWVSYTTDLVKQYFQKLDRIAIIAGGATRNETIWNIAQASKENFGADKNTVIVTHDAVRPFVSLRIIHENVTAVEKYGVCDTVIRATDTIVQSGNGACITDMPVRNQMYQGQTPQSFRLGDYETVYAGTSEDEQAQITDACKLFFLSGFDVHLVQGDVGNFKITYPFDYKIAQALVGDSLDD